MSLNLRLDENLACLNYGPSGSGQQVQPKRWYLPRHNLKSFLGDSFKNQASPPERVFISGSYLRKFANLRLGGSLASVLPSSFKLLIDEILPFNRVGHRDLDKISPLHSKSLVHSLDGPEDPAEITRKILESPATRLFWAYGPGEHRETLAHFRSTRLKVFEVESYNRLFETLLEASLYSSFLEIHEDLKTLFQEESLFYKQGPGEFVNFSEAQALRFFLSSLENPHPDLPSLYLGQELWGIFSPSLLGRSSPWGFLPTPKENAFVELQIQPTTSLDIKKSDVLFLENLSFDPGPMRLGRGLKPMVWDALQDPNFATTRESSEMWNEKSLLMGEKRWNQWLESLRKEGLQTQDSLISKISTEIQREVEVLGLTPKKIFTEGSWPKNWLRDLGGRWQISDKDIQRLDL